MPHVLDNPAWSSLTGVHAAFAEGTGLARRYRPEISPIVALHDTDDPAAWSDLSALVGPGTQVVVPGASRPGPGWTEAARFAGVQLVATPTLVDTLAPEVVTLGSDDVPEMLGLVERNEPGPFAPETYRLGTYLGIRRGGALVAMAGERQHPTGYTEISAVCTDAEHRGQGLAAMLVRAVAAGIRARGEVPFLHASAENVGAIRLYETLGFAWRRDITFGVLLSPA